MTVAGWLPETAYAGIDQRLAGPDTLLRSRYPGERAGRQPVHTVYVPADRYTADLPARWGAAALELLAAHAATPHALAAVLGPAAGPTGDGAREVYDAVVAKLAVEPVEDLRIDAEDGYLGRSGEQEDADVTAAAAALGAAYASGTAPPFAGLRFKSLEATTRRRGLRSLDLFLGTLVAGGPFGPPGVGQLSARLPAGLRLTLPKVSLADQVEAMVSACEHLEAAHALAPGDLGFEVQIETPAAVVGADGGATVARIITAGAGRVSGLHFGTYDYTASIGIGARYQSMAHPAADHAKAVMQAAAAGTGVRLSDGSVNVVPVGDGDAVRSAWALHAALVRRSLERGFYQGWDLHPGQLVTRYAATYAFFRDGAPEAAARVRDHAERRSGGILDEPATVAALAGFLTRGLDCGATDPDTVTGLTGMSRPDLARLGRR